MSKIKPSVTTAFAIAFTKDQLQKQEERLKQQIDEITLPRGPQGARGEIGPMGPQGLKGDRGPKGDKGLKGDRGPIGLVGPQGEKGEAGEIGPRGLIGPRGEVGPAGPQGIAGPMGLRGLQGERGEIGPIGPQGPQGIQGPAGLQGPIGPRGEIGPQGLQGLQGERGEKGERGLQGVQGLRGPQGLQGPKGDKGDPGATPDLEPLLNKLISDIDRKLEEKYLEINRTISGRLTAISTNISGTSGGGSYKLLDNADVEYASLDTLSNDTVLIYDAQKRKFVAQSIIEVLERSGYNPSGNTNINTGGDLITTSFTTLTGTNPVINFQEHQIDTLVSYVVKDKQTNRVVSVDVTVTDTSLLFETFEEFSFDNFTVDITYLSVPSDTIFEDVIEIPSGNSYTVTLADYNITRLINFYVLDPSKRMVDVDAIKTDSQITVETIDTNIDLTNHTLVLISNK